MNVTVAEEDKLRRKLTVEVPLAEVSSVYDEVFGRLRSNIRVDGFRPGKFPRHLAEKRFQSVMAGEAMQTLVPKYFDEAVKELELRPATEPRFENLDIDKKRPFKFDVEFEVMPTFKPLAVSAFALEEQKVSVSAKDVEQRLEELRSGRAAFEDKGAAAAAKGDSVVFDFVGLLDGKPFEGGSGENQRVEVGAGQYLPDFDAQFPGIKAGDTKEFDATFPDDYGHAALSGKTVHFTVTAKQVERKVLPALDDAFVKSVGDFETLDALKEDITQRLTTERRQETMQGYQTALAEQMREHYAFEVPESLVEQGLHDFEHRLSHDEPDLLNDEKALAKRKTEERGKIEANLRVAYAIDALARQYEVKADPDELRQRFFMQAYMMGQNPSELMKSPYGERMMMQLEQGVITSQTLGRLAEDVLKSGGKPAKKAATKTATEAAAKPAGKPKAPAKAAEKTKAATKPKAAAKPKAATKPKAAPKAGAKAGAGKSG